MTESITTLDVLSGSGTMMDIGVGWNEEESRGLGFPFQPLAERFETLEPREIERFRTQIIPAAYAR